MGLFDSMNAGDAQMTGLLGGGQPAMLGQQGGLAGHFAQQSGLPPMPPELQQAIQQMKGAPPQQKQDFIQTISEKIMSMPKDPAMKQQAMQQFMQAMSDEQMPQQPMLGGV